ncbi:hypothetical protein F5Y18DRAFT_337501 [Xylariaceae sp. FL1019]|nr:hypothetical protein F5Y18DRAFT_337501 [Xylariaceae sp. FL1019]
MSDVYHRTGRGGAGNFYSHKDAVDATTKQSTEDIEAQKPISQPGDDTSTTPSSSTPTPNTGYARSGRGGAGNFTSTSTLPTSSPATSSPAPQAAPAARPAHTGRGGAGNWASGESEGVQRAKAEQEAKRKAALDAGIVQEIRDSLPPPPRIHHLHAPGRGRRPGEDEES